MKHLEFLFAAYTAVWLILSFYIFVLIRRNRRLEHLLDQLASKVESLKAGKTPSND